MTDENMGLNPDANINVGRRLKAQKNKPKRVKCDRKAIRRKCNRELKVGVESLLDWEDGLMTDISETGARIEVASSLSVSNQILIYDSERGYMVVCDVVRRCVDHIGVRFTDLRIGLYPKSSPFFMYLSLRQGRQLLTKRRAQEARAQKKRKKKG